MKYLPVFLIALVALCFIVLPAKAQDNNLLSLGVGFYDINDNEGAADFRLEYRWDNALVWQVKPWAGLEATSDGAAYAVGGLLLDLNVAEKFLITPSFGAGLYHDGGGKDLGHAVEFRSQLELGYKFDNQSRIGIAGGHISNASIGDSNPGTEFLTFYYHIPVGGLF